MAVSSPQVDVKKIKTVPQSQVNYTPALTVLTSLFFMWGFLTCLNDIIIPHLKAVFSLNYTQAMLIQFCFFGAYFIVSLPSGILVEKIGYKKGIIIGLVTAGIGCLLFYPAAGLRSYPMFLLALFILAAGITLLQVAANPYVAILGKPETASSRLNLTQAFNSLGTTIAPYFGSLLILSVAVKSAADINKLSPGELSVYQAAEAGAVQVPYLGLAAALFIIAGIFAMFKLPVIEAASASEAGGGSNENIAIHHESAWGFRHLVLGAIGIFVYVGAEVSIGSFLVSYLGQPFIAGLPEAEAGKFVSFYWGGAMLGRFAGSAITRKVKPGAVLAFNAFVASALVLVSMFTSGHVAMWSILLIGLFNSIMFPTIFTLAIDGLGKHTGQGSGILCMAIVGGALLPLLQGFFADNIGIHHAFFLPAVCYLFIAYYGLKGHIPTHIKTSKA
ncbi:MAG: L-fucose:H+ symporter permease [Ignavibacteria bacterium]|jgi:FHS family L-fucose permease-like MFS transporter|nr:L-fucose:H+ symporter permease [Ignavibacteria bacterium]MCU7504974.1 L-fucose:H+ symporter permease [Ignavibacteria bacterium]MCU7514892.1 L-fucose:H+ symporter permease [Ignavibacteria bacterium]